MTKPIYCGPAIGLYDFGKFRIFMESLDIAKPIWDSKQPTFKCAHDFQIWCLNAWVLVDYRERNGTAEVFLDGDPAEKSEIEEMILSAAAATDC